MGEDESVAASATGPDWAQFGLAILAIAIISLAAVAIPALGGGGLGLQGAPNGDDGDGSTTLREYVSAQGGEQRPGDGASGDAGAGSAADAPGEALENGGDGAGTGAGGDVPSESDDAGEAGGEMSGSGDGSTDAFDGDPGDSGEFGGEPDDGLEGASGAEGDASGTGDAPVDEAESGFGDESGGEFGESSVEPDGERDDAFGDRFEEGDGTSGEANDGEFGDEVGGDSSGGDESDGDAGETVRDGSDGDRTGEDRTRDGDRTDDAADADRTGSGDGTDSAADRAAGYEFSFDESPTPGATVAVTVTDRGEPVEGATVHFNDERIGTTDASGTVVGDVPFTETLEVRATSDGEHHRERRRSVARAGAGALAIGDTPRQFAAAGAVAVQDASESETDDESRNESRTTVEMNPETALELEDPPVAGTTVEIAATVDDNPIPAGTVLVDGEERGRTDADGTERIELPETPQNATIAVERGEIRAERTVAVRGLSLEVAERVPLPGRTVDAEVRYGDEPAANATVFVDGEAAATAGPDGAASVRLPFASETTLGAALEGATAETTVDGLYRNAALAAFAAVGALALGWWILVRRLGVTEATVRSLPRAFGRLVRRAGELARALGRYAVDAVVRLARGLERVGSRLSDRLRRAVRWLAGLPEALTTQGLAALAAAHPIRLYRWIVAAIRSLFRSSQRRLEDVADRTRSGASAGDGDGTGGTDRRSLRELWREFVRLVRPPGLATKTPGEIGRYAVERGVPEPPVRTVVDAFRDAEYGDASPSGERIERVRSAVRAVADADGAAEDGLEAAAPADGAEGETGTGTGTAEAETATDADADRGPGPTAESERGGERP